MADKTVMIIDDDADTREVLKLILQMEGYTVRIGKDVTDLYEIEKNPPGLILLDNWLDGKTGHDICFQLKITPKTAAIPVVLISASLNLGRTAESCRADGFICKPFDNDDLLQTVARFF
ncbi:MAG: response regulator [Mucilaginibacter sp.]|nr:response regulator [Mucilaginibacter sp.]